jgi:hypothetical protein
MSEEVGLSVDGGNSRRRLFKGEGRHTLKAERGVERGLRVAGWKHHKFVQFTYRPARR